MKVVGVSNRRIRLAKKGPMDIKTAEALSLLIMRIDSQLNDSVALVRDKCSSEELQWYRREAGNVMGTLHIDIQERLWTEHSSLRTREMGGD